ncbi:hypothetical protein BKK50_08265 [Rodentibacter rarus]|uniref:Uncharacterized protein n=1 Tax=Rodentibacter rarus TaxID=1908260 RepID=A0A1V3IK13_9PAST|nr:hypothetical protein [Rodentibacter rarus]OOF41669.1 hypothetical protein BKK50_08265 [Rodentibacter rarus]
MKVSEYILIATLLLLVLAVATSLKALAMLDFDVKGRRGMAYNLRKQGLKLKKLAEQLGAV